MMQERHRTRVDATLKAIPHNDVVARSQAFEEWRQCTEVIAIVGIPHNDVVATCRADPGGQCRTIAPYWDVDHSNPIGLRDLARPIGASVIRD
jgi:hypothetical protein